MGISIRSMLTAGVTTVTASAIAITPTVAPPPAVQRAEVALSAQVSSLAGQVSKLPTVSTPRQGAVLPNAQVGTTSDLGALSAGSGLIDLYNAAEPWVQWGFEVGTWVVGWVPVVGFFSGQIMVAYFTIEPLVFAGVQSLADLLDSNGGAIPGNIWNGVVTSATNFIQGEINWVLGFFPPWPPLPPFPPRPFAATQTFNAAATPTALGGPIGNGIVAASNTLANASHAIWNSWYPVGGVIGDGVAAISDAFAKTVNSVGARGGEAIDTFVNFGVDQVEYLTGISTPRATGPAALRRTLSIPPALTDALRPLEVARDAIEAQLQAGADAAKAADLPASVQKATDRAPDIKAPGKAIRAALSGAFAAKIGPGKAGGDSPRTALKRLSEDSDEGPVNGLGKAVKKAVTGLQNASKTLAGKAKSSGSSSNTSGSSSNTSGSSSNASGP